MRLLEQSLNENSFKQIFFNPLPPDDLKAGYRLHCQARGLDPERPHSLRALMAHGLWLLRREGPVETKPKSKEEPDTDEIISREGIGEKFGRLFRRAAAEYRRTKQLTKLLNAKLIWKGKTLQFHAGQLSNHTDSSQTNSKFPWYGLGVDTYDRMSIVLSEINRANC